MFHPIFAMTSNFILQACSFLWGNMPKLIQNLTIKLAKIFYHMLLLIKRVYSELTVFISENLRVKN